MAKCSICGKGVVFGQSVSHSHRRTNRAWKPNIRKVKAVVNGTHKTVSVAPAAFVPARSSARKFNTVRNRVCFGQALFFFRSGGSVPERTGMCTVTVLGVICAGSAARRAAAKAERSV